MSDELSAITDLEIAYIEVMTWDPDRRVNEWRGEYQLHYRVEWGSALSDWEPIEKISKDDRKHPSYML